jgi:hypothetical protein
MARRKHAYSTGFPARRKRKMRKGAPLPDRAPFSSGHGPSLPRMVSLGCHVLFLKTADFSYPVRT